MFINKVGDKIEETDFTSWFQMFQEVTFHTPAGVCVEKIKVQI